jgi:hypothetical protein
MIEFICGVIFGISAIVGLSALVLRIADAIKPKAEAANVTASAVSVDLSGNAVYTQTLDEQLRIFKLQDEGRA